MPGESVNLNYGKLGGSSAPVNSFCRVAVARRLSAHIKGVQAGRSFSKRAKHQHPGMRRRCERIARLGVLRRDEGSLSRQLTRGDCAAHQENYKIGEGSSIIIVD